MKCRVWFPLCVVACSLRSDSRARRLVGSELNCTPGKRGGVGGREQGKCLPPSSLLSRFPPLVSPLFFILREFFSRALLFERLEQATCVAALTCCVHSNDLNRIWLNSIKSSLKILIIKMKVVIPSLTSSEHPRFVSDKKEISLRKQPPLLAAETSLVARSEDRRLFSHSRK